MASVTELTHQNADEYIHKHLSGNLTGKPNKLLERSVLLDFIDDLRKTSAGLQPGHITGRRASMLLNMLDYWWRRREVISHFAMQAALVVWCGTYGISMTDALPLGVTGPDATLSQRLPCGTTRLVARVELKRGGGLYSQQLSTGLAQHLTASRLAKYPLVSQDKVLCPTVIAASPRGVVDLDVRDLEAFPFAVRLVASVSEINVPGVQMRLQASQIRMLGAYTNKLPVTANDLHGPSSSWGTPNLIPVLKGAKRLHGFSAMAGGHISETLPIWILRVMEARKRA